MFRSTTTSASRKKILFYIHSTSSDNSSVSYTRMGRNFEWFIFFLLSIFLADAQTDFCFDATNEGKGLIIE